MNTLENILEEYPGPWRVSVTKLKSGGSRIELLDNNESPVATLHGETIAQAEALGRAMCALPELIFKETNN